MLMIEEYMPLKSENRLYVCCADVGAQGFVIKSSEAVSSKNLCCAQVALYMGYQSRIAVQLKLLLWPAVLAYALEVYTWALMTAGGWGMKTSVSVVYLVLGSLQLIAIAGAAGISPFM